HGQGLTTGNATGQVNAWRAAATTHTPADDAVADYAALLVSDIAFAQAVQDGTGHQEYLAALWTFAATSMTEANALHLLARTTMVRDAQGADDNNLALAFFLEAWERVVLDTGTLTAEDIASYALVVATRSYNQ